MKQWPIQIDPYGCGCTECITGEYISLDRAKWEDVHRMATKEIGNATNEEFAVGPDLVYVSRLTRLRWEQPGNPSNWPTPGYKLVG